VAQNYQQAHVSTLVSRYLDAERQAVPTADEISSTGVLLRVLGGGMPLNSEGMQAFYLDAVFDGTRRTWVDPKVAYKVEAPYINLSALARVPGGEKSSYFIFPALTCEKNCGATRFEWISLSAEHRACLLGVYSVKAKNALPLPLWLMLGPRWSEQRLYQSASVHAE
jgi:hypothetical protein